MEDNITYKRCPNCNARSGFCLTIPERNKNKKYICQDCKKETKFSKWGRTTTNAYLKEFEIKSDSGFYKKK